MYFDWDHEYHAKHCVMKMFFKSRDIVKILGILTNLLGTTYQVE